MKRNSLLIIALCILAINASAQPLSEKMAARVMDIWKDSLSEPGKPLRWTYENGILLKGLEGVWKKQPTPFILSISTTQLIE